LQLFLQLAVLEFSPGCKILGLNQGVDPSHRAVFARQIMEGGIGCLPAFQEAEVHGPECFLFIFPEWMIWVAYEPVLLYANFPDV
jgi:hypothetical protein